MRAKDLESERRVEEGDRKPAETWSSGGGIGAAPLRVAKNRRRPPRGSSGLGSGVLRASSFEPFVTNSETESFLYMRRLITHSGDTVFDGDDDDDDDRMTTTMIAIYIVLLTPSIWAFRVWADWNQPPIRINFYPFLILIRIKLQGQAEQKMKNSPS